MGRWGKEARRGREIRRRRRREDNTILLSPITTIIHLNGLIAKFLMEEGEGVAYDGGAEVTCVERLHNGRRQVL